MKRKLFLILGVLILLVSTAGADFKFQFYPIYTEGGAHNYEVGSGLLQLKAQTLMTTPGASDDVTGLAAWLGHTITGFDVSKVDIASSLHLATGTTWNGACTPSGGSSPPSYSNIDGTVNYTRNAFSPNKISVGTDPTDLYQLNFRVFDNNANASTGNLIQWRSISMSDNAVFCNWNSSANRLTAQDNFDYAIVTAAPPAGFTGPAVTSASTDIGNTVKIDYIALSNVIGAADLTPPIKYDVYRSEVSGFTPTDGTNRVKENLPSGGIGSLGGAANVLDGPNTGVPGSDPNRLSDCTIYYYKMRAKDSTVFDPDRIVAPQHKTTNTDDNTHQISAKPHDFTAPLPATWTSIGSQDRKLLLRWNNPGAPDFGGVVVARRLGAAPDPTLRSASGDEDGEAPPAVGTVLRDGSVVVYKGTSTQVLDGADNVPPLEALNNGVTYNYKIFAYDRVVAGPPREQGYNYSASLARSGAPGVAPGAPQSFVALSGGEGLTLRWYYPAEDWYGGALIVGTTDVTKWVAMEKDSYLADPANYKLAANQTAVTPRPEPQEVSLTSFGDVELDRSGATIYYFKAFSYNSGDTLNPTDAGSIASHQFSSGSVGGARVALGGGGPVTYTFRKAVAGLGLNAFAVLHDIPLGVKGNIIGGVAAEYPNPVNNVADLVTAINAVCGLKIVYAVGWLGSNNQMEGYYVNYDAGGLPIFTSTSGAGTLPATDVRLSRGLAYQISVNGDCEITLWGK